MSRLRLASRHLADRLTAVLLIAVSALLAVTSVGYGLFRGSNPGPGLFPLIIATILGVLSVAWLVSGAGPACTGEQADTDADLQAGEDTPIDMVGYRRIGIVVVWSAITVSLMEIVGYVPVITVYVAGLLVAVAHQRIWVSVLCAFLGAFLTGYGAESLGIYLPDPFGLLEILRF